MKLLPCPFCGNASPVMNAQFDIFFVRCDQCKAIGGFSREKEKSVEAWNNRSEPKGGALREAFR